jgi:hypothetical protein
VELKPCLLQKREDVDAALRQSRPLFPGRDRFSRRETADRRSLREALVSLVGKTLNLSIGSLGVFLCQLIKPAAPSYGKFLRAAFHLQAEGRSAK